MFRLAAIVAVLGFIGCTRVTDNMNPPAHAPAELESPEDAVPENTNERAEILEKNGFEMDHRGEDYVQYTKGPVTVDLDTDDDGIHVTPIDKSATGLNDSMLSAAYQVYELLGLDLRDLTYEVTPSDGFGPEIHRSSIGGWKITKRVWPNGVSGMFVAFSVEKGDD